MMEDLNAKLRYYLDQIFLTVYCTVCVCVWWGCVCVCVGVCVCVCVCVCLFVRYQVREGAMSDLQTQLREVLRENELLRREVRTTAHKHKQNQKLNKNEIQNV